MEDFSITKITKTLLTLLLALTISIAMVGIVTSQFAEDKPTLYVDPPTYTSTHLGEIFEIDVKIEKVTSDSQLIGAEFKLRYNTTILETNEEWVAEGDFLKHFAEQADTDTWFKSYVEVDYGLVGVLILPNENGNWTGPFPEGSGTLATISFRSIDRSESPFSCDLQLHDTILIDANRKQVLHNLRHGRYEILALPLPKLEVLPEQYSATHRGEIFDIDININDLDRDWRLIGAEFKLCYNATLLDLLNITEGGFLKSFGGTWFQSYVEYDYGLVGVLILPLENGTWIGPFPEGNGILATITFNATLSPWEATPSSLLQLDDTILIDVSINKIPHTVNHGYYKLSPHLTLVPDTGFAATSIIGGRFAASSSITIKWDGTPIPTVPSALTTDPNGNFTAIISVPTQSEVGLHLVIAVDNEGNKMEATFTVVDMRGSEGPEGPKGDKGDQGPQGEPAPTEVLWASIIIAIIAIVVATYSLLRKKP